MYSGVVSGSLGIGESICPCDTVSVHSCFFTKTFVLSSEALALVIILMIIGFVSCCSFVICRAASFKFQRNLIEGVIKHQKLSRYQAEALLL